MSQSTDPAHPERGPLQNASSTLVCCLLLLLLTTPAVAQEPAQAEPEQQIPSEGDFTSLSLEELMEVEVTSVSKKKEKLRDAPAAIYVVTAEEIRRSGATSLPEALRMVPGIQVARIDASRWAITARGFAGLYANKLLVLIDGRSVYSPLFSGVYWDIHDVMLEDVERIEVIRGPGGALWGANAGTA